MKKHIAWLGLILLPLSLTTQAEGAPPAEQAPSCKARMKTLPKIPTYCGGLDREVSLEGNPFVYSNPDGGCDLGLNLPGLPSFGFDIPSIDSCKILQMVTGELVGEVNATLRDAINKSLDEIPDFINTTP